MSLDRLLYMVSIYALPLSIGLLSVFALVTWKIHDPNSYAKQLAFRVMDGAGAELTPAQALAQLGNRQNVVLQNTHLSEAPFWFAFQFRPATGDGPSMVEFPSRHANDIACWDAADLRPLGSGSRVGTSGGISQIKAGYALALPASLAEKNVLCRGTFIGPARISLLQWPAQQLNQSEMEFYRNSGLLDGGLIILALFVLITALINREATYVLFATWILVNLRMGALSAGWDAEWLGRVVPQDLLLLGRPVTIAIYNLLTITWFVTLFRDDLPRAGYALLLRCAQWTCLPLLLLSVLLPYKSFLPVMWALTGFNIMVLVFYLGRILVQTRSRVALLYSASIGITLFASFHEVISAALGFKGLIGSVNSVTAALSSTLLAALAIAERMRMEHNQRLAAQSELEHTYKVMPIGLFALDMHGQFLNANPALQSMLGWQMKAGAGTSWAQHFNQEAWTQLHHLVSTQTHGELELKGKQTPDGDSRHFMVRAALVNGKIEGLLQDVTEQFRATENLRFMANNDPLTKVFNRRGIEKALDSAIGKMAEGKTLALAYLDLDRFKLINDLFGHSAGDEVLKQVCERITKQLSGHQNIGRVGGDEFIIVLPSATMPFATRICRNIVDSICTAPYRVGDKAFQVRGSIGLIEVSTGMQIKDIVSTADRACREAKAGNHEGLVVYEKNASAILEREAELNLVERLSSGTATDSLFLEMQPIMSLTAPHASLNFEVLLRMRDHDGSVIPAGNIIVAAENSGCIGIIDRWVLSTTLAWLDSHHTRLVNTQFVCMNLSGASLNDERFVRDAFAILAKNIHIAGLLCVEITESVALYDLQNTRRFIDQVRSYGVRVALDDFGAGYTSFSYLKQLPADLLKIDGNFIVNMNAHPANIAIVEAIVNLAQNLGMKTIAEWAEDNATVETLAEIGVDYVQGYAVARPQAPEKLLLATSSASFIQDAELVQIVRRLGHPADGLLHLDPLDQISRKKLH